MNNTDKYMNKFFDDFENLFVKLGSRPVNSKRDMQFGDYTQTKDAVIYVFPVAGCSKEDVSVELDGDKVKVNAEFDDGEFNAEYTNELTVNEDHYDMEKIEASVKNGLLKLSFPFKKTEDKERKRKIL